MLRSLLLALLLVAQPVMADESDEDAAFQVWLANYKVGALARGLKPEWLETALAGLHVDTRVIALDQRQPGSAARPITMPDYLAGKFRGDRIPRGQSEFAANRSLLDMAEQATGVPARVITAIWGIETSYGRVMGGFDLPAALATLAYEGRRRELFTAELDAVVRIVGEGRMARETLRGSWAGAFGQSQFLPSSYLASGRDGDGDGRIDIMASLPDVFASIGAYLANAGWRRGEDWGFRAIVPAGLDRAALASTEQPATCKLPLSRHSRPLPASEWRARGVVAVNAPWPADGTPMTLVEPDGVGQGAYLTTPSYRAILKYNCSNFYALSVGLLADAIAPR